MLNFSVSGRIVFYFTGYAYLCIGFGTEFEIQDIEVFFIG